MGQLLKHLLLAFGYMMLLAGSGASKKPCPKLNGPTVEESFYIRDEFRTGNIEDISSSSKNTHLHGKKRCPRKLDSDFEPCPSFFTLNFDPNRKPPAIAEVNCACEVCLAKRDNQLVNSTYACVPVYYYRNVLEKDSYDCFVMKTIRLKVGCECIGDRKHRMEIPTSTG